MKTAANARAEHEQQGPRRKQKSQEASKHRMKILPRLPGRSAPGSGLPGRDDKQGSRGCTPSTFAVSVDSCGQCGAAARCTRRGKEPPAISLPCGVAVTASGPAVPRHLGRARQKNRSIAATMDVAVLSRQSGDSSCLTSLWLDK